MTIEETVARERAFFRTGKTSNTIKKTARRAVFCILIFESFAQKQRRKHQIR